MPGVGWRRGESVLITSRTNHAVDVIGNIIEHQLGAKGCLVRGGRRQYLRDLKRSLDQLLHGIFPSGSAAEFTARQWKRKLARLDRRVAALEEELAERSRWELKWGRFLAGRSRRARFDPVDDIKQRYLNWRVARQVLHADVLVALETVLEERLEVIVRIIQRTNRDRIERVLTEHRSDLVTFLKALRARRRSRQDRLFAELDTCVLLEAFPVWLVSLADVHKVLPLQCELFDLVIIDEATQCDMASSLPVLQRARRAVVVGDPRQRRHLSFLSRHRQRVTAGQYGLGEEQQTTFDYRDHSILDLVSERLTSQKDVLFLNEHFRSLPPIIRFSNRSFYDGALRIMTHTPRRPPRPPIEVRRCGGVRDGRGVNKAEGQALIQDVIDLAKEQDALDRATAQSIGILSPFRDQIDFIAEGVRRGLSATTLTKHRVMTGTAHTFQGEERDVMFISFGVDAAAHPAAFHYLNRPDQFNVAITRARVRQLLYVSVRAEDLDPESLLAQYLRELAEAPEDRRRPHVKDAFLRDVAEEMRKLGYAAWPSYAVAGTEIDLVIEHRGVVRGIDLIGYPGRWENAFSLERYQIFHRAGLRILPLPYASWILRKPDCLAHIRKAMTA